MTSLSRMLLIALFIAVLYLWAMVTQLQTDLRLLAGRIMFRQDAIEEVADELEKHQKGEAYASAKGLPPW